MGRLTTIYGDYWLLIIAALVTQYCVDVVNTAVVITSAAASDYDARCQTDTCTNGECYVTGDVAQCNCGDLYTGEQCETVNLDAVELIVIGSMVIFKWPHPIRLENYSFIYYCLDDPQMTITKHRIVFANQDSSVLVGNLRDGVSLYRICIDTEAVAELSVLTQSTEYATNCINVSTQMDYHSLAGWFLAALSAVAAVALVYLQKDKIELLYFHRSWNLNNGYNYNVDELIRNEKLRKAKDDERDDTIVDPGSAPDVTTATNGAVTQTGPIAKQDTVIGNPRKIQLENLRLTTIADVSTA